MESISYLTWHSPAYDFLMSRGMEEFMGIPLDRFSRRMVEELLSRYCAEHHCEEAWREYALGHRERAIS